MTSHRRPMSSLGHRDAFTKESSGHLDATPKTRPKHAIRNAQRKALRPLADGLV